MEKFKVTYVIKNNKKEVIEEFKSENELLEYLDIMGYYFSKIETIK